jgi:hypothetical protein
MKAAAFGSSTAAAAAMKRDTDAMIIVCRPQPAARLGVGKWQRAGQSRMVAGEVGGNVGVAWGDQCLFQG